MVCFFLFKLFCLYGNDFFLCFSKTASIFYLLLFFFLSLYCECLADVICSPFSLAYFDPEVDFIFYYMILKTILNILFPLCLFCLIFSVMFCAELLLITNVNPTLGRRGWVNCS